MIPQNKTVPAVNPANLGNVPVHDLIMELNRRKNEVVFISVTPSDLSDYWGTDNNGNPLPSNQLPSPEAWSMALRAFNRWEDGGAFTELMEAMGDAWAEHQMRKNQSK
jgi:hypothetical protein